MTIGPWPMHEVVLMAVRKAVSAATRTFTANSMMRCFFIFFSLIDCFLSHTEITEITEILRPSDSFIVLKFFYCPAEMKEIKEIFRFTLYAQPVPEALSVISVNFCVPFSRCRRRRCRRCRSRAAERCRRSPRRSRPSPATWPRRTSG